MTYSASDYITFQCKKTKDGILVEYFNGISDSLFKSIIDNSITSIHICENVRIGISNLNLDDKFEIVAKLNYSIHHCNLYNICLKLYKFRGIKCTYGLKNVQVVSNKSLIFKGVL